MNIPTHTHTRDPTGNAWRPLAAGAIALVALVGGLGYWAVSARIAGAVVSSGSVQVQSNRQVVQHLQGGVVAQISVKDGDFVAAGQSLIRFDDARLRSDLIVLQGQLAEILARSARLEAERDDLQAVEFSQYLKTLASSDPAVRQQMAGQMRQFDASLTAQLQESEQIGEQIRQIENRIAGTNAQLDALSYQELLVAEELAGLQSLLEKGLVQNSRVLELKSEQASLRGRAGKLTADIAEMRGQMAGKRIDLLRLQTRRRQAAISTLRDIQYSAIELSERQLSLKDTLSRLDVRAPVSGIVYGNQVFALRSVVQPGAPIMYVIPQDQPLIVAARIEAVNIDQVQIGQQAQLRFPAFDQRRTPEILATVSNISADIISDPATGKAFYAVELVPKPGELAKLGGEVLLPGMPVEAFIKTGDRSPLAYLTKPLTDYFVLAFRD